MGGNQALRDAGSLAQLLPMMVKESYGTVTDEVVQKYLTEYEKEMIPRCFKWVKASEEGHDLFDTDTVGGQVKFWMIILIMRIVKYIALFVVLVTQIFSGKRKSLIERVER
jgi:2-polyprenyl-6-methoxyphenol hydroxylase-like FAD-dependent oxidoreductase